jgi:hypothetical protein
LAQSHGGSQPVAEHHDLILAKLGSIWQEIWDKSHNRILRFYFFSIVVASFHYFSQSLVQAGLVTAACGGGMAEQDQIGLSLLAARPPELGVRLSSLASSSLRIAPSCSCAAFTFCQGGLVELSSC